MLTQSYMLYVYIYLSVLVIDLENECGDQTLCMDPNSQCIGGMCLCVEGYVGNNNVCQLRKS